MYHWLGTTGLRFIASSLYAVSYTCWLTFLYFFFFFFVLNPGIKELELAAGKGRTVSGGCWCSLFPVENVVVETLVLRWHGQNVESVLYL